MFNSIRKVVAAVIAVPTMLVVGAGIAAATPPTPAQQATTIAQSGISQMTDVVVALAPVGLGLLVLVLGIRMGYAAVRSRGQRVV